MPLNIYLLLHAFEYNMHVIQTIDEMRILNVIRYLTIKKHRNEAINEN